MDHERVRLPAWLLSTVAHLALLVVLALVFQGSSLSGTIQEQEASGGIVLSRPTSEQTKEYFQPTEATTADSTDVAAQASPLPDATELAPVESPQSALPDLDGIVNAGSDLVPAMKTGTHHRPNIPSSTSDAEILSDDVILNAPPGPEGPPAAVNLFRTRAVGHSFLFLIDRSASMGADGIGALRAAEKALLVQLGELKSNHQFQIVTYNQRSSYLSQKHALLVADDFHKKQAAKFLDSIIATGATKHDLAILTALARKPDVIFLLTDGGDPVLNAAQLRTITVRNNGRTKIHTLQFGWGAQQSGSEYLETLSRLNGGSHRYIDLSVR